MEATIICSDALTELRKMKANSVDSLVTDPPAGISFMSKKFDTFRNREHFINEMKEIFSECVRVMKPGAHGLVWAIPRTSHWTATALEDAGFQVREKIYHLFGQGFPKSHNISKGIDKLNNDERPIVGKIKHPRANVNATYSLGGAFQESPDLTIAASAASAAWEGWGSALKPAAEEWIMIRKPLEKGLSIAANVLKWGCGGINIDAARIGTETLTYEVVSSMGPTGTFSGQGATRENGGLISRGNKTVTGRFPANLILSHHGCVEVGVKRVKGSGGGQDLNTGSTAFPNNYGDFKGRSAVKHGDADGTETVPAFECTPGCPVRMLDEQSGALAPRGKYKKDKVVEGEFGTFEGKHNNRDNSLSYGDSGGASRFFYCAKASKRDKNAGCEGLGMKVKQGVRPNSPDVISGKFPDHDHRIGGANNHPTVKSTQLMRYLITMITPPGGVVLDCFAGSGSTHVAAIACGFRCISIEQDEAYCAIADARIKHANNAHRSGV